MTTNQNYQLVFRRYAPFDSFGGGFEGDKRTSASVAQDGSATFRTSGRVSFSQAGEVKVLGGRTSGTRWRSAVDNAKVSMQLAVFKTKAGHVVFRASSAGSNPMVLGSPDIDTFVTMGAIWWENILRLVGHVSGDAFPNCEVFVKDPKGNPVLLVDFHTKSGEAGPFYRLFGSGSSQQFADFDVGVRLNADGTFGKVVHRGPTVVKEAKLMPDTIPRMPLVDHQLSQRRS